MVYVFFADGFEELEAITSFDILKHGKIDVKSVGVGSEFVRSTHGLTIKADLKDDEMDFNGLEGIVLPGGIPGTNNLKNSKNVADCINFCIERNLMVAAICAAPSILGEMELLAGKNACCYPGFEKHLKGAKILNESVVVCDNIITANGPGSAVKFGFALVSYLKNEDLVKEIKTDIMYE